MTTRKVSPLSVRLAAAFVTVGVAAVGVWLRLSLIEWLWISCAIGLVIFAELMNTAIAFANLEVDG